MRREGKLLVPSRTSPGMRFAQRKALVGCPFWSVPPRDRFSKNHFSGIQQECTDPTERALRLGGTACRSSPKQWRRILAKRLIGQAGKAFSRGMRLPGQAPVALSYA